VADGHGQSDHRYPVTEPTEAIRAHFQPQFVCPIRLILEFLEKGISFASNALTLQAVPISKESPASNTPMIELPSSTRVA
jgi:hypothetical protein